MKKEDGDSFGLVGFREPVTDEVFKKIENMDFSQVSETGEGGAKWERLNEQEEREYHLQRAEFFAKQEKEGGSKPRGGPGGRGGRGGGRGGRGGGRGGRGGGQKRSRDDGDAVDQPDNKKSKKE